MALVDTGEPAINVSRREREVEGDRNCHSRPNSCGRRLSPLSQIFEKHIAAEGCSGQYDGGLGVAAGKCIDDKRKVGSIAGVIETPCLIELLAT